MENLCGSMSRINLGETVRNFQQRPRPSQTATGISRASKPFPQMARDHSTLRTPLPAREPSVPLSGATEPRMSGSGRTYVAPTSYRQEPMLHVAIAPRYRGPGNQKVRPSQLQKLCKAFDGSSDPYDHVARFSMQKTLKMCTLWCKALG